MTPAKITFRSATTADLPVIVALLADDRLGAARERVADPLPQAYRDAFAAIAAHAGSDVILAMHGATIVGCLQLTLIPNLSRRGTLRGQIEGVRVANTHRGQGVGELLLRRAIARAAEAGCGIVQLTSDNARGDAVRFYKRLGFVASHVGLKLDLGDASPR